MDRGPLEREMLRSGIVLACGTVPCFSLLPGQVPPILLKAERVSSPESPPLLWYVTSREAVSWSGMGSLALLLWYAPHAEGEGGGVPLPPSYALGKTPGPPPTSSHLVLMSFPSGGSPGPRAQYTSLSHPCSKISVLCPGPPASGRDATLWLALGKRICCSALSLWLQGLFPCIFSL